MYLTVFFTLFVLVIIENYNLVPQKNRGLLNLFVGFILVLHDGLRWNMGTDFLPYLDHFNIVNIKPYKYDNFELFYVELIKLSKSVLNSYTFFLLLHGVIFYSLVITSLRKYSNYTFVALSFFYVSMIGLLGSNRQLISLALCFFSVPYLVDKRRVVFFGLMILAFGFHRTSIVFLSVLLLNRKINVGLLIVVLLVSFMLSMSSYVADIFIVVTQQILPSLFENKAEFYLYNKDEISNSVLGTFLGLVRKALPIFLLIFIQKKGFKTKYYDILFNISILSFLTYILFNNNLQFLVGRLTSYFSIFECVVYSWFFMVLYRTKFKFASICIFSVFCTIVFFRSISIYPEIFIPYRSVFSK